MATRANRKHGASTRAGTECSRGAAIGAANGLVLSVIVGTAEPLVMLLSAAGAAAVGALIGLLVWSASSDVPDDPVVPPPED